MPRKRVVGGIGVEVAVNLSDEADVQRLYEATWPWGEAADGGTSGSV